jgi:hypothetical protein
MTILSGVLGQKKTNSYSCRYCLDTEIDRLGMDNDNSNKQVSTMQEIDDTILSNYNCGSLIL